MKKLSLLILLFCLSQKVVSQKNNINKLNPITQNNLWGYINNTGKTIIKPRYKSVGHFSEGLVPVRLKGTYGFLNSKDKFKIKPQYDFSYSFFNGIAKVYINAKPYFINKKNKKLFEHNYIEIYRSGVKNTFITVTKDKKYGLVDSKGKVILKHQFNKIYPFKNGRAILNKQDEAAMINEQGKFIVPFGRYDNIYDYNEGYYKVELNEKYYKNIEDFDGIMNSSGKLLFTIPRGKWHIDYGFESFSDGLITIEIENNQNLITPLKTEYIRNYKGVINTQGQIVFSDYKWQKITPFKYNVAFAKDVSNNWYLINKKGEALNKVPFKKILYGNYNKNIETLFKNGIDFVKTEKGWGVIDTSGNFIKKPKTFDFEYDHLSRSGNLLIFHQDISIESDDFPYQYGFWNIKNDIIISPKFHFLDIINEDNIIKVIENNLIAYIDFSGNYIWKQQDSPKNSISKLDIDFMLRGYFYASSPLKKESDYNGWGESGNIFKKGVLPKHKKDSFGVYINSEETILFNNTYEGFKLYISNNTKDTIHFNAQDSRLYLTIQAKDKNNVWKDIEHIPNSWCGNSYHSIFLPSNHYWEFSVPKYYGEFKTLLRAKLLYKTSLKDKSKPIYSNTFKGSINPAQFWRKDNYQPRSIMDPYNN